MLVSHATWIAILFVSLCVTLLVVLTTRWHSMVTADSLAGVQKVHVGHTPRVGGLGIYVALWAGVLLVDDGQEHLLKLLLLSALAGLRVWLDGRFDQTGRYQSPAACHYG